jgi:hypothetical protein
MGRINEMGKPALLTQKYQDLEKAVFEITEKFGEKEFDHIQLLREVFKRGFIFDEPRRNYRSELAKYVRKLAEIELEKLEDSAVKGNEALSFKKENLLLLREIAHYYIASRNTLLWYSIIDLSFTLFKDPYYANFLEVLNMGSYYITSEILEKVIEHQKYWEDQLFQIAETGIEKDDFIKKYIAEVLEQQQYEVIDQMQEEQEEEELLLQNLVEKIVKEENKYMPPEVLKEKLSEEGVDFSRFIFDDLRYELLRVIQENIENIIAEDEEMWNFFAYGDLDDIGNNCKDLTDYQNKDCKLLYLFTLWKTCSCVPKRYIFRFVRFVKERIKFDPISESYIDLLYHELGGS